MTDLALTQPTASEDLDREAFRAAIKARYVERGGCDETSADMLATATLEAVEAAADGFGAPGWDWTAVAAAEAADDEMECWHE